MRRRSRSLLAVMSAALTLAAAIGPAAASYSFPAPAATSGYAAADLGEALAPDGTFLGSADLSGTIDPNAWRMVSDLAAGEPPRFAPAVASAPNAPAAVESTTATNWYGLGSNGAGNGALTSPVYALAIWGGSLVAGGDFVNIGGDATADYIVRWNGTSWAPLGSNGAGNGALNAGVRGLGVQSTSLIVGGLFTNAGAVATADYVAKFSSNTWSGLGSNAAGTNGALTGFLRTLLVSGTDVYVGGNFTNAFGTAAADYIARWNGSAWSALGSNGAGNGAFANEVMSLAKSGSNLYAAGAFLNAAGLATADYVARWNGSAWSALGSNGAGNGAISANAYSVAVSGSTVYVGGGFLNVAGIAEADHIAAWNGSAWSALGSDGAGNGALNSSVMALFVSGAAVYAGGFFTNAAGKATADYVAMWVASTWQPIGSNGAGNGALPSPGHVDALFVAGSAVYVGGSLSNVAGQSNADYVALALLPAPWSNLGSNGLGNGALNGQIHAFAVSGSSLVVGGEFTNAGGDPKADYVALWNGTAWSALGSNMAGTNGAIPAPVYSLAVSGSNIYVGGIFTDAAGLPKADRVAMWNGSAWSALGSNAAGTDGAISGGIVYALATYGNDVYLGGNFANVAGDPLLDNVMRWNGASFNALGSNGAGNGALNGTVYALAMAGNVVTVGGNFTNAAGMATADRVARWNTVNWVAMGSNGAGDGAVTNSVYAVANLNGDVYIGGLFTNVAGNATSDYVAKFGGGVWSSMGSNGAGIGALGAPVHALATSGSDIYVAGEFIDGNGDPTADYVDRWSGSAWVPLGPDPIGAGALKDFAYALGPLSSELYVGGRFTDSATNPLADYVVAYGAISFDKPDARIKVGSGSLIGNNIYNADGAGQARSGSAAIGVEIIFTINIQNDGNKADTYTALAQGTASTKYDVKYFKGTTDITNQVINGAYVTASVAAGGTFTFKAKVTVLNTADVGSSVTRLVTIRSRTNNQLLDAVQLTASRN